MWNKRHGTSNDLYKNSWTILNKDGRKKIANWKKEDKNSECSCVNVCIGSWGIENRLDLLILK